jgi:hypothetical protein
MGYSRFKQKIPPRPLPSSARDTPDGSDPFAPSLSPRRPSLGLSMPKHLYSTGFGFAEEIVSEMDRRGGAPAPRRPMAGSTGPDLAVENQDSCAKRLVALQR